VTNFTSETLERLTGLPLSAKTRDAVFRGLPALAYTPLGPERTAALIAEADTAIAARKFRVVGDEAGIAVWEKGWREVADQVRSAPHVDIETLKPQYFHLGVPFRLLGEFVHPDTDYFEYYAGIAVRRQLMAHFLEGTGALLELGCGTGINLLLAADLFPKATLAGSDWTRATLDILEALGKAKGRPIASVLYNMLDQSGRENLPITGDTDVLTVHALEQLGPRAAEVIEFLIAARPRRCLHLEPILEFYDPADPFDAVAQRFHLARSYLQGLVPALKKAEAMGRIRILGERRVRLGNGYHDAYSYIAWSPA
jgi:hypothetical protein